MTMPSEIPNFILRGARLATMTQLALEVFRTVCRADTGKDIAHGLLSGIDGQSEESVCTFDKAAIDDFCDAHIDFGEVVDGDLFSQRFDGRCVCRILCGFGRRAGD